jgi:hypothetical protein
MTEEFDHGHEPRAEEIALHQRFLTLLDRWKRPGRKGTRPKSGASIPCSSGRGSVG